jgi:hypothetical protein
MCIVNRAQIAQEILDYLFQHKDAQDTLEGIVQWWFLEQRIRTRKAEVEMALRDLITKGLIVERRGGDAKTRYGINHQKIEEISELVKTNDEAK